jgi:hypothetical protein
MSTLNRLLQIEDFPLTDPEIVLRDARFDAPPTAYRQIMLLINALYDRANALNDEVLLAEIKSLFFSWDWQNHAIALLKQDGLVDNWGLTTHQDLIRVSFVTFAEHDTTQLFEAIEQILEEYVYSFQAAPEALLTERFWHNRYPCVVSEGCIFCFC